MQTRFTVSRQVMKITLKWKTTMKLCVHPLSAQPQSASVVQVRFGGFEQTIVRHPSTLKIDRFHINENHITPN